MIWKKRVFATVTLVLLAAILSGLMVSPALGQQPERVKVLIGFTRQPGPAEQALVHRAGGAIKYTYHLVPAIAATVPERAIDGLRRNPNVTSVDLDGQVWAVDTELDNAWGVKRIGAGSVHDSGNKGAGVKVAIIDSGIDYTHPDLDANYAGGWDFVNGDNDPDDATHDGPMDDYGHGTHVAGTVAAEDNDVGVVGVAPGAVLYALKVLNQDGFGNWSHTIAAVQWCVDNGMQVANLSLGFSIDPGETVKAAFDSAETAGVVIVAAAGNSGNPPGRGSNVIYPAEYDSVIAVAATDSKDKRASWSSTGDQVELAAPGVSVFSTWNDSDSPHDPQPVCYDGVCYKYGSGTSMASPHVAGTAALVIATGVTDANGNGRINDEVRLRLDETADDLGDPGRDAQYGFGLVDADEAAVPPGPSNDPPTVSITSPADGSTFDSGATIVFEGTASDTDDGDLTASLSWTSSIDGPIGSGGSFSTTLSDGNHTITASVADTGGKTGSASISITVGTAPSEPTTVSVSSITYAAEGGRDGKKHLSVTIALVDDLGNLVSGASVSIDVELDTDFYASGTGTTGADGTVPLKLPFAPSGCYSTEVTSVTADGLMWDGATPENEFCK